MKYRLEDRLAPLASLLYDLQWRVISVLCAVILGVVVTRQQ